MVSADDGRLHDSADYHDWLEQQRRFVFLYLLRRLLNSNLPPGCDPWSQAEDLTQDVMIRLLLHPLDEQVDNPRAYISTVASHRLDDFYRRANRERDLRRDMPRPHDDDRDDDARASARAVHHPTGGDFAVLNDEMIGDIWDSIGETLDATGDPQRNLEIIQLAVMGYSYAEIAVRLDIPEARVKNVMNRMRQKLAKLHPEWAQGRRLPGPQRRLPRDLEGGDPDDAGEDAPAPPDG